MSDDHNHDDVQFIRPPDDLARKAPMTAGGVDPETIAKAEAMIASLQTDYLNWAEEDAAKLLHAYETLVSGSADQDAAKADLFRLAHDMKGQGGSFGFDLITIVGDQLCRFLESIEAPPSRAEAEVVKVHVEAIRLILAQRMKGDGGREGAMLLDGLQRTIRKVSA